MEKVKGSEYFPNVLYLTLRICRCFQSRKFTCQLRKPNDKRLFLSVFFLAQSTQLRLRNPLQWLLHLWTPGRLDIKIHFQQNRLINAFLDCLCTYSDNLILFRMRVWTQMMTAVLSPAMGLTSLQEEVMAPLLWASLGQDHFMDSYHKPTIFNNILQSFWKIWLEQQDISCPVKYLFDIFFNFINLSFSFL